jgi:hypothetical protein
MGPPKEILFEIDLVPGTWYLGKDLRLENPRPRREGFALSGAVWRSLAAFNTGVDLKSPFGGLWRPLAAFGASLARLWRVFVELLWVVPRLCGAVEGRAASLGRCRGPFAARKVGGEWRF